MSEKSKNMYRHLSTVSSTIHSFQNAVTEMQAVSLNKTPQLSNKELMVNVRFTTSLDARVTYTISAICFHDNGFCNSNFLTVG
jgi:hypothetical protein